MNEVMDEEFDFDWLVERLREEAQDDVDSLLYKAANAIELLLPARAYWVCTADHEEFRTWNESVATDWMNAGFDVEKRYSV